MSTMDMGESLVGAYLRHIEQCPVVIYNCFFGRQGEIDVVGVKASPKATQREIFLCEVTTHIRGMQIPRNGKDATTAVVKTKLERLRQFAEVTFPGDVYRFQWWSPYVSEGGLTQEFAQLKSSWEAEDRSLEWIINDQYTDRIGTLLKHAGGNTSTTGEPAYRLLQILTHLRGTKPEL